MKYRCIKPLVHDLYSDDGKRVMAENTMTVLPGEVFERNDSGGLGINEIHLDSMLGFYWVELSADTLAKHFEVVE